MKTKTLFDFGSEAVYITKQLNNGDFNYRLAIKVLDMPELTGDDVKDIGYKYHVSIIAVSPDQVSEFGKMDAAISSCGFNDEQIESMDSGDPYMLKYEALLTDGIYANLEEFTGNNLKKLLQKARGQLQVTESLFGFYMDKYQNRLGATGWDWIKGDLTGEIFRGGKNATPETKTIRAMG